MFPRALGVRFALLPLTVSPMFGLNAVLFSGKGLIALLAKQVIRVDPKEIGGLMDKATMRAHPCRNGDAVAGFSRHGSILAYGEEKTNHGNHPGEDW